MTNPVSQEQVKVAMQAGMDSFGGPFQCKHLTAIGKDLVGHDFVKDGGSFMPVSRIADRLLQECRKAGKIKFRAGFWFKQ